MQRAKYPNTQRKFPMPMCSTRCRGLCRIFEKNGMFVYIIWMSFMVHLESDSRGFVLEIHFCLLVVCILRD